MLQLLKFFHIILFSHPLLQNLIFLFLFIELSIYRASKFEISALNANLFSCRSKNQTLLCSSKFWVLNLPCQSANLYLTLLSATCQAVCQVFGLHGSKMTTVTALSVLHLLVPALNFVAQCVFIPDRVVYTSAIGIAFVAVAVLLQLKVVRQREKRMKQKNNTRQIDCQNNDD